MPLGCWGGCRGSGGGLLELLPCPEVTGPASQAAAPLAAQRRAEAACRSWRGGGRGAWDQGLRPGPRVLASSGHCTPRAATGVRGVPSSRRPASFPGQHSWSQPSWRPGVLHSQVCLQPGGHPPTPYSLSSSVPIPSPALLLWCHLPAPSSLLRALTLPPPLLLLLSLLALPALSPQTPPPPQAGPRHPLLASVTSIYILCPDSASRTDAPPCTFHANPMAYTPFSLNFKNQVSPLPRPTCSRVPVGRGSQSPRPDAHSPLEAPRKLDCGL